MRGRLQGDCSPGAHRGLIPACAGQTSLWRVSLPASTAHPRVCGADMRKAEAFRQAQGSSPRVRGRLTARRGAAGEAGLIPACAGQTIAPWSMNAASRAHPRVCGADPSFAARPSLSAGSSPRVRGRPRDGQLEWCRPGLIPACAGQTPSGRPRRCSERAHPRVCGADVIRLNHSLCFMGSSPRVRGRLPR